MLKTQIKAGQITNLTDARYFAAWEVSWVGFDLNEGNSNYINPLKVLAMKEWIEGPKTVGEFGLQSADFIKSSVEQVGLDYVQVDMLADKALLQALQGLSIIKEIVIESPDAQQEINTHLEAYGALVDIFLIDCSKNGIAYNDLSNEMKFYLSEICQQHKIILSIHIDPDALDELIDTIQPLGLHVKGGAEEKVGFKSFDELDELFEALEILV